MLESTWEVNNLLRHTPLCTQECYNCDDDGCGANDVMTMTMTMDANLCKYSENLLEGSKIFWDTYLCVPKNIITMMIMVMLMIR